MAPTVNDLKFRTRFSFCNQIKCCFFRAGIHKMLRLLLQKQSDLGLGCLSKAF